MDAVRLYWIPLGAGAHVVRTCGRLFEGLASVVEGRRRCDLYHSALEVVAAGSRFVVEVTPVVDGDGGRRGVVGEGPVGTRGLGRFRLFRYEIRCWRDGVIPDADEAVRSPVTVADDVVQASRVLELVPSVPTPVWGRDELGAGEMWNSNSVTAWLLACGGVDMAPLRPPPGGRAPGWDAGVAVADRAREPMRAV